MKLILKISYYIIILKIFYYYYNIKNLLLVHKKMIKYVLDKRFFRLSAKYSRKPVRSAWQV
jgi:hypothetical protein